MANRDDLTKKREVLESVLKQIKKAYGEGAVMWLGEHG